MHLFGWICRELCWVKKPNPRRFQTMDPEFPSSHGHTVCTATHGSISSERNPETSWVTSKHQVTEEIPTLEQIGKAETQAINPTPSTAPHKWEGTSNTQLLPEEQKIWKTYLVPQFLRLSPERWASKTPSSESQWGLQSWVPQDYGKQRTSL